MQICVDTMVKDGTMNLHTTTWASRKAKGTTKSNEQDDVGYYRHLHINFLVWLRHTDIKWAKSQISIG